MNNYKAAILVSTVALMFTGNVPACDMPKEGCKHSEHDMQTMKHSNAGAHKDAFEPAMDIIKAQEQEIATMQKWLSENKSN